MINSTTLIGNLGNDPKVQYLDNGTPVASFSVACHEFYKDKDGTRQKRTHWIRCSAFGRLAEVCSQYLRKGNRVGLHGPLHFRSWVDKEERKQSSLQLQVRDLEILDWPDRDEQDAPAA